MSHVTNCLFIIWYICLCIVYFDVGFLIKFFIFIFNIVTMGNNIVTKHRVDDHLVIPLLSAVAVIGWRKCFDITQVFWAWWQHCIQYYHGNTVTMVMGPNQIKSLKRTEWMTIFFYLHTYIYMEIYPYIKDISISFISICIETGYIFFGCPRGLRIQTCDIPPGEK